MKPLLREALVHTVLALAAVVLVFGGTLFVVSLFAVVLVVITADWWSLGYALAGAVCGFGMMIGGSMVAYGWRT